MIFICIGLPLRQLQLRFAMCIRARARASPRASMAVHSAAGPNTGFRGAAQRRIDGAQGLERAQPDTDIREAIDIRFAQVDAHQRAVVLANYPPAEVAYGRNRRTGTDLDDNRRSTCSSQRCWRTLCASVRRSAQLQSSNISMFGRATAPQCVQDGASPSKRQVCWSTEGKKLSPDQIASPHGVLHCR